MPRHDFILVGDRVLIRPTDGARTTDGGLYLPATVTEQERVQQGEVVQVGPGYLTANPEYTEGEPWASRPATRFLPLQAEPGDQAFFLRKEALEIQYDGTDYLILPHQAILALLRPTPPPAPSDIDDLLDQL